MLPSKEVNLNIEVNLLINVFCTETHTVVYSNPDSDSNPDSTCIVIDIISFHSFSHCSYNTSCVGFECTCLLLCFCYHIKINGKSGFEAESGFE